MKRKLYFYINVAFLHESPATTLLKCKMGCEWEWTDKTKKFELDPSITDAELDTYGELLLQMDLATSYAYERAF